MIDVRREFVRNGTKHVRYHWSFRKRTEHLSIFVAEMCLSNHDYEPQCLRKPCDNDNTNHGSVAFCSTGVLLGCVSIWCSCRFSIFCVLMVELDWPADTPLYFPR